MKSTKLGIERTWPYASEFVTDAAGRDWQGLRNGKLGRAHGFSTWLWHALLRLRGELP